MASGLLIPPTGCSNAQPTVSASAESCSTQPHTQCEAFSVLLKDAVKNTENESAPFPSEVGHPSEPVPGVAIGDHVTADPLIGIVVVSVSQVSDGQEAPITDAKTGSVPMTDASAGVTSNPNPILTPNLGLTLTPNTNPQGSTLQNIESTPLLPEGMTVAVPPNNGTSGHEAAAATNPSQPKTTDISSTPAPQPALNLDISNEISTIQLNVPTANKPAILNGHVAPTHVGPILFEQPSDASPSSGLRPPNSLNPDQGSPPNMENQGNTNLLTSSQGQVQGNGVVPTLVRPATDVRPMAIVQVQGDHETTLLNQSLSVRAIEESGGEQGSLGDPTQGDGEGGRVQFNAGGTPESMARSNQFPFFTDQLISARQIQSLPQATGSPVAMSTTDHLKLTQSLLGGEHSGTMTSATSGMAQTVHLELPSHDSGPLNVRISMLDQTVHTQFTTDRSELGAMLMVRQDQLQQNLIKSGLELGQFQVHVNQEGRQDALPDRQFRRNDGTPEQQLASQDHHRQAHDRERPTHRPTRTLSLFA